MSDDEIYLNLPQGVRGEDGCKGPEAVKIPYGPATLAALGDLERQVARDEARLMLRRSRFPWGILLGTLAVVSLFASATILSLFVLIT